jgi:hypothetical protein
MMFFMLPMPDFQLPFAATPLMPPPRRHFRR